MLWYKILPFKEVFFKTESQVLLFEGHVVLNENFIKYCPDLQFPKRKDYW